MTTPGTEATSDTLRDGLHKANALESLLEEEFELLKAGDLDKFEALQLRKSETLDVLSSLLPVLIEGGDLEPADAEHGALIDKIKIVLARCRDSHLRNAMLIDRKIESARSALDVLRSSRSADVGETYDKLGRLKRGQTRGRQTEV